MEALEKVSAMIRSLPGKWKIVKLYLIIQRRNRWTQIGSSSLVPEACDLCDCEMSSQ